jgi:membrane-bound lytic murein transglycosylase A
MIVSPYVLYILLALLPYWRSIPAEESAERAVLSAEETREEAKVLAASPAARSHLSTHVLLPVNPDTLPVLSFDPQMLQALYEQANYLERRDTRDKRTSGIGKHDMLGTVRRLQELQLNDPRVFLESFDFYRVNTSLKSDRVRVTGYYTPVLEVSPVRTAEFQFPLLRRPAGEGRLPAPSAIRGGALDGQGLELAWVRTEKELKNAQLQGSCLIEFPDGTRHHLGFGGSVRGRGGAYVFFKTVDDEVLGAGAFPLTAGYSVAVDPRYIPIGSTLLAELPDLAPNGRLKGYKYRVLFAQDRGGAILTTKRIDLYCGVGKQGLKEAHKINGHGRLWLMLPKQR